MATLSAVELAIQMRIGDTTAEYKPAVTAAILSSWAIMAASAEFWFLQPGVPVTINLTPNVTKYEVDKENIGIPFDIIDADGKVQYVYRNRRNFADIKGGSGSALNVTGFFTRIGRSGNKKLLIQFDRAPEEATTVYLQYQEAGTVANIGACPDTGVKCLIHGAMSQIAPPKAIAVSKDFSRWDAVTYKENELFYAALSLFVQQEARHPEYKPEPELPDYIISGFTDIETYT